MPRARKKTGRLIKVDAKNPKQKDLWMTKDIEGNKLGAPAGRYRLVEGSTAEGGPLVLRKLEKGGTTWGEGPIELTLTQEELNLQFKTNLSPTSKKNVVEYPVEPDLGYISMAKGKGEGGKGREAKAKATTQRHTATRKGIPVEQLRQASHVVGRWQEAAAIFADQRRALDQLKRGAKADKAAAVLQSLIRSKEEQELYGRRKEEGPKSQLQKIEEADRAAAKISKKFQNSRLRAKTKLGQLANRKARLDEGVDREIKRLEETDDRIDRIKEKRRVASWWLDGTPSSYHSPDPLRPEQYEGIPEDIIEEAGGRSVFEQVPHRQTKEEWDQSSRSAWERMPSGSDTKEEYVAKKSAFWTPTVERMVHKGASVRDLHEVVDRRERELGEKQERIDDWEKKQKKKISKKLRKVERQEVSPQYKRWIEKRMDLKGEEGIYDGYVLDEELGIITEDAREKQRELVDRSLGIRRFTEEDFDAITDDYEGEGTSGIGGIARGDPEDIPMWQRDPYVWDEIKRQRERDLEESIRETHTVMRQQVKKKPQLSSMRARRMFDLEEELKLAKEKQLRDFRPWEVEDALTATIRKIPGVKEEIEAEDKAWMDELLAGVSTDEEVDDEAEQIREETRRQREEDAAFGWGEDLEESPESTPESTPEPTPRAIADFEPEPEPEPEPKSYERELTKEDFVTWDDIEEEVFDVMGGGWSPREAIDDALLGLGDKVLGDNEGGLIEYEGDTFEVIGDGKGGYKLHKIHYEED